MIIFISELQKKHLKFLYYHSTQVLGDFCKLSIDYLNNGVSHKKYDIAAAKLGLTSDDVQNLIQALVSLLVEGCKHNLSDADFKSSLALAGFSNDQQEVLLKLYCAKQLELSQALYLLHQKDPNYQHLTWRLEMQIASKNVPMEMKPIISMNFVLMTPKNYNQKSETIELDEKKYEIVPPINLPIAHAKATSQCQNIINRVFVQCDLPNLVNLVNKLEQAMKESKSQHIASKNVPMEMKPIISMNFVLMTPKNYNQKSETIELDEKKYEIVPPINLPIAHAKATSQCQNIINRVFVQCDLPNLVNLVNKLEQAMKESKSQHVRKIQRVLQ